MLTSLLTGDAMVWILGVIAGIVAIFFGKEKIAKHQLQKENTALKQEKVVAQQQVVEATTKQNNRVNEAVVARTKVEQAKPTPDKLREDDGFRRD